VHENVSLVVPMPPNPELTKGQLVAAAEELFAARGIDGVSLREIQTAAGIRNATAIQYHFGDRDGLLQAVLAKHHPAVETARHQLLDAYEAAPPDDALRALAGALVRPSAAKLRDRDGGRAYLRILAQLVNQPDPPWAELALADPADSTYRWRQLVAPLLPEVAVRTLHRRFAAIRITFVELARRAEERPRRDDRLFVSHLTDLVTGILTAPLSAETVALLAERDGGRPRKAGHRSS
jgi:AcrR family transcriptional regulator